ncbi:MAG: ArsB/NhaD family transporter [Rickettsiales bacterium]|nr:ArsB/NhaD family transporter [Rickettsiales bacterium]
MQVGGHGALEEAVPETLLFGFDPFWFAVLLFGFAYLLIMTEKINRAIVALLGAGILIIFGVMNQHQAIAAIDFGTLGLLAGMMVIVHITGKTGVFQYLAVWSVKKVDARPWGILLMISVITAVFSALLDNVTTVLLLVPVLLRICKELEIDPYPYLFTCIFASNIGGTATYIGDPPNILIGSALGLSFNDFLIHTMPAAVVVFIATMIPIYFIWGKKITASKDKREKVMAMNEKDSITDPRLLIDCLGVCFIVVLGFVFAHPIGVEPATIAMSGAALLLLLENLRHDQEHHAHNVHAAFAEAEWVTLFFFVGLFIMVGGIERVGFIEMMGEALLDFTQGNLQDTAYAVLWVSAYASAFLDNIPFTATMIPMIKSLAPSLGGEEAIMPLWWALSLGACFGGNGTLIGASANLVVAGFAERDGQPIRFMKFLIMALPLMTLSIIISHVYIYFRYFGGGA